MPGPAHLNDIQIARCHRQADAQRWGVSIETFGAALAASVSRWAADRAVDTAAVDRYLEGLHLADLALACGCAAGHDGAWEHFVGTYRPQLRRAADALDPTGGTHEVADALYADLYGSPDAAGERRSLFRYFHGRSSLSTWLRAVLSQRHVDRIRVTRRFDPLPEDEALPGGPATAGDAASGRTAFLEALRRSLGEAVAALAPRDRLRLACYYREDMTLAEIGRMLGEHEATASRQLARARRTIRDDVTRRLRDSCGFSDEALAEGFRSVIDDAGSLDLREWLTVGAERKNSGPSRSTE